MQTKAVLLYCGIKSSQPNIYTVFPAVNRMRVKMSTNYDKIEHKEGGNKSVTWNLNYDDTQQCTFLLETILQKSSRAPEDSPDI